MGNDNNLEKDISERVETLRAGGYSYESLLRQVAEVEQWAAELEDACEKQSEILDMQEQALEMRSDVETALRKVIDDLLDGLNLSKDLLQRTRLGLPSLIEREVAAARSSSSKRGANALHDGPLGKRKAKDEIRKIWASGKYSNRDLCAEEECSALDISFSTARKALRGTPDPT